MKKTIVATIALLAVLVGGTAFIVKSSTGIAGETGSPGEGSCGGCHGGGFALNSSVTISATPAFSSNEYIPGQTYTLSMIIAASSFSHFGFGCEIINSSNVNIGLMQNAGSGVKFLNNFNGRLNAVHTTPKNGAGSATFSFEWVAPSTVENVKIYVAGNAVNLDGNTTGDYPILNSLALTSASGAGLTEHTMNLSGFNVYPNPASGKINLTYGLKEESMVSMELISINGQQITSLLNEKQTSGIYQKAILIPNSVASGVYFIKLSANNQKIAQRLITIN